MTASDLERETGRLSSIACWTWLPVERQFRGNQVFDGASDAFENSDSLRSRSLEQVGRQVGKFAADGTSIDDSAGDRADDLAGLTEGARAGIDIKFRARNCFVVDLAHFRRKRAHQIEMLSGLEPGAANERLPRKRRAAVVRSNCANTQELGYLNESMT